MVIVLGIESTSHTFGVGLASEEGILANENEVYLPPTGGIHPREAADHHAKVAPSVLRRALSKAGVRVEDIDAVAVALGPGLGPALRVGAVLARALALKYGKPLVPVHHGIAHIEIAKFSTKSLDPLVVLISGGHTAVLAFVDGRYRVFGETIDVAIGNAIDSFAREAGLGMPGVPKVEECARGGSKYIPLPYTVKGQDLSFSGLVTKALELWRSGANLGDVCLSLIETAYYMLAEVTERALALTGKKELVLCGGVARSRRLKEIMEIVASSYNVKLSVVPSEYAGDNGAMIAYTGVLAFRSGVVIDVGESYIRQKWRIDEVEVPWVVGVPGKRS